MKISRKAIDRPRVVLVTTALVIVTAILAAYFIPVQRTPAISKAVVLVSVPFPGSQPTEVEEQITRKIEDVLGRLKDVDYISSTSMRGSSVTQIVFLDGVDADAARGEVKDLVDQIRRELPTDREVQPVVIDIDFESTPLMLVNMSGPPGFDRRALKRIADDVQEDLERIPGVANTQAFGGREREIHVDVDLDLVAEYGVTLDDLLRMLGSFHAALPGGSLDTGDFDFQVRNDTKLRSVSDIREIVIRHDRDRVIRISDVAEVKDTYRRTQNVAQLDGEDCATIIVNKEAGVNTLAAAKAVKARVRALGKVYPHIKFSTTRDTSEDISIMFRVLGSSFVFGTMLVLIILAWTMGLRISLLVLLAIPLSSAVALCFLFFFGIPVSNMVIFSFILALGLVVDGAIIVAENIHRHVELGEDPVTAAKVGIDEVALPVLTADLTTIAAFLPMLLVPGIMGDFMSVMPKVVSVALFGSILVDHFLIPTLAAYWYRRAGPRNRVPRRLGLPTRAYVAVLNWALDNRWAVVACAALAIVWAGMMFARIDFIFFPPSDRGQFEVKYELPLGSSIRQTVAASEVLTEPLKELQNNDEHELIHFVSAVGSSEGLASRLETDPAVGPEFGTILVQLESPLDRKRHEAVILRELRKKFDRGIKKYPGMKYTINEVQEGPPGGYDVAVRLTGDHLELLGEISDRIAARLMDVPGTVDVGSDYRDESPEIVVKPNDWAEGLFDVNDRTIAKAVQTAITGDTSIRMSMADEDVTLRLKAAKRFQRSRESLARLMLTGASGRRATIGELADLKRGMGLYAVNRYKQKRAVVAKCNLLDPTTPDDMFNVLRKDILPPMGFQPVEHEDVTVLGKAASYLRNELLPRLGFARPKQQNAVTFLGRPGTEVEGVRATFTGENEERDKNYSYLVRSMVIAVVLIFAILVFQFNSIRQAVIVMLSVPLSFIGVVAGMWLCHFPFSLASFIGLVSLTGIVVNDAIVVVDFINRARRRGLSVREATIEAGIHRLRPVMLTTATTIGGLLPLFLNLSGGAEFWGPLTGAIIFGLAFATVLTLVVVPVGYSLTHGLSGIWGRRAAARVFARITPVAKSNREVVN